MRDLKQIAVAPLSGGACRHLKLVAVAKEAEREREDKYRHREAGQSERR